MILIQRHAGRAARLAAACLLPATAAAEGTPPTVTLPPEQIVVTATRSPSPVEQIAAGVSVIDRGDIELFGDLDLPQALGAVPGLRVAQSGGPGAQASVFIRGTNSNQVLVLRDGVPVNDPATPGGGFNFGNDTLNDVERIEVVRGPLSSVYGGSALGGVINLISRPAPEGVHGELNAAGGTQATGELSGRLTARRGIWDFAATAEGFSFAGFDQTPSRIAGYSGERDGFRSKQATAELGARLTDTTRASLYVRARDSKTGYDSGADAANASGYDASLYGRAAIASVLLDGAWHSAAFVSRLQNDRRYRVLPDAADPGLSDEDSRYHGRRTDAQWTNTLALPDLLWFAGNTVSLAYEHAADSVTTKVNSLSYGSPFLSTARAHADTDGLAFGFSTTLAHRLTVTGQARQDWTTLAGDATTWRAGAVLALPELASRLKFSYGTGFRAPALADRYGIDNFGYVGNPALRPEFSDGWEAGVVTELGAAAGTRASLGVTYFDNRLRDLIQLAFSPVYTSVNVARARAKGVETELTLRRASWLAATLAYTYTDARSGDGDVLLRRPFHTISARLALTPLPGLSIAPEVTYTGGFQDYLVESFGNGPSAGYTLVNLNATWQATPRLQLYVHARNVGAARYEPVNGYAGPGRQVLVGGRTVF